MPLACGGSQIVISKRNNMKATIVTSLILAHLQWINYEAMAFGAVAEGATNQVGFVVVDVNPGLNLLCNPFQTGSNTPKEVLGNLLNQNSVHVWNADQQAYSSAPEALLSGEAFFFDYQANKPTNIVFIGQVVPGPGETRSKIIKAAPAMTLLGSSTSMPQLPSGAGEVVSTWEGQTGWSSFTNYGGGVWIGGDPRAELSIPLGSGFFYRMAPGLPDAYSPISSSDSKRQGTLGVRLLRSINPCELLLTLSGYEARNYIVLSKSDYRQSEWIFEGTLDGSVSPTFVIALRGRTQAVFDVLTAEAYSALSGTLAELGEPSHSEADDALGSSNFRLTVGKPNDWFVDKLHGNDDSNGRRRTKSGQEGPFATLRKAMRYARPGDRVFVAEGVYADSLNLVGKNVQLIVEGKVILN
jgi:hypothetical protein